MDTRGYSGYGSWDSGSTRGYEGYDYGYGYSQGDSGTTGNYGYDSYESYDSRSSLNDRDLYRSGYSYSEAGHDQDMTAYDGRYDSSYGNSRDQFQNRAWDNYGQQGQNWARDGRNKRSMASSYSGYMGGQWNEPLQSKGGRGPGASGSSRLPSLFSHSIVPEHKRFQGLRGFSGNFGVGAFKQQMRKNWKMWDGDKPQQKKKVKKDTVAGNKRKQTNTTDEPDSKVAKNETANSESENEGKEGEDAAETGTKAEGADEGNEKGESGSALTIQEEISQIKKKLQAGKKTQDRQKKRQRDRMVERIQFVCSLCKYRTFYEDEMTNHLDSRFHKDHFKFVGTKLPQQTADFLQDYVANKTKKTEERRKMVEDINAAIQQIFKDQDLTTDLPMEHFVKKVEAAHCTACDLFIPMQHGILQKHLRSIDHNHNRKVMMEQSKKSALIVARSILNNKMISKKLEKYLKGENPFTDDSLEKGNPEGEGGTEEAADESKGNEEVAEDEAAEDEQPEGTEEAFTTEEEEKQVEEDDEDQPMEEEENELAE